MTLQIDATYFTSSNVVPPRLTSTRARPIKAVSSLCQASTPVPAGLATPQELKAAVSRGPVLAARPRPPEAMSVEQPAQVGLLSDAPRQMGQAVESQKNSTSGSDSSHAEPKKPRPPVAKRPKQAPSIFIPKGKKVGGCHHHRIQSPHVCDSDPCPMTIPEVNRIINDACSY
jgi:senataxin